MKKFVSVLLCGLMVGMLAADDILIWGNMRKFYSARFTDYKVTESAEARPPLERFGEYKMAALVYSGKAPVHFSDADMEIIKKYVVGGGILLLDVAVPIMFGNEQKISDLSRAESLLGARTYVYGGGKSVVSALGKEIFGGEVNVDGILPETARNAGLAGLLDMKMLLGSDKIVRLGVHRYGRGAVVYTALRMGLNPEYDALLLKLVGVLLNPEERQRYFPAREANRLAGLNGQFRHLAIHAQDGAAGELLQEVLSQQTGQSVFAPHPTAEQFVIHVGMTPYAESLKLDLETLHPFGYYMVCRDGKNLVLAGKSSAGTAYAVADFLKRFTGYRDFGHGRFNKVLPSIDVITLPEKLEIREEPDIDSYTVAWTGNTVFGRTGRTTTLAGHNLWRVVPPEKYGESHPEYYPLVNGKRVKVTPKLHGTWNPCLANPDLPELVRQYADEYFKSNPDKKGLPMGVNDGAGDCQCDFCREELRKYGNQYSGFYNMAARELQKTHPGRFIHIFAYSQRALQPPRNITLEPNILVEVTGMSDPYAAMEKWRDAGAKLLGVYDYMYSCGTRYTTPRFYPSSVLKAWRKACAEYGLKAIWVEYYPASDVFDAPRQYVLNEFAWNRNVEWDALLDDYCRSMYGAASKPVKNFFTRLDQIYARSENPQFFWGDNNKEVQMKPYTFADVNYLKEQLAQAKQVKNDPVSAWKVNILSRFFDLVGSYIQSSLYGRELENIREIKSSAEADEAVKLAGGGYEQVQNIREFTMSEEEEENIFTPKHDLEKFNSSMYLNPEFLLDGKVERVCGLIAEYFKGKPGDAEKFWTKYAASANSRLAAVAASQLYQLKNPAVNLIANPGFEPVNAPELSDGELAKYDWNRLHPGLKGWSTWRFQNSVTKFYWDAKEKHSGKYSVGIGENQIAGCIQTGLQIEPGCRYRLSFRVKRTLPAETGPRVRFMYDGKWYDAAGTVVFAYPEESIGQWAKVTTAFTAPPLPEGAKKLAMLLLLNAPIQPEGEMIWFDDVELVKISDGKKK